MPTAGGTPAAFVDRAVDGPFTVDASYVYWADIGDVFRQPL